VIKLVEECDNDYVELHNTHKEVEKVKTCSKMVMIRQRYESDTIVVYHCSTLSQNENGPRKDEKGKEEKQEKRWGEKKQ
jgi:hypothetical protein